jgi:hypothetical protein
MARDSVCRTTEWHLIAAIERLTHRRTRPLAPLLAPVFRWNHGKVMADGGRGLARELSR